MANVQELITNFKNSILPQYVETEKILGVYAKGSLVNGYTDHADFDIYIIWEKSIPEDRGQIVKKLHQGQSEYLVVDYKDVHLDRFVVNNQEFNIGHITAQSFEELADLIFGGREFLSDRIIKPLTAVSGFYYGTVIIDEGILGKLRQKLQVFPVKLQKETKRIFEIKNREYLQNLEKLVERGDVLLFNKILVDVIELFLITYFSANRIYFPGIKWLNKSFAKFNLNSDLARLIDECLLAGTLETELSKYKELVLCST